jgi:polysaccharide pyruvyl transferase WcaK-like protein
LYKKIVKTEKNVHTTCDPVINSHLFSKDTVSKGTHDKKRPIVSCKKPYTVISIRSYYKGNADQKKAFIATLSKSIAKFYRQTESELVLFSAQKSPDMNADEKMSFSIKNHLLHFKVPEKRITTLQWNIMGEAAKMLQSAKLIISNRLHSLLIAARSGVALVGIVLQDKIRGCLEMIGLNDSCSYVNQDELSVDSTSRLFKNAWDHAEENRQRIIDGTIFWGNQQPTNMDLLIKTLNN